MPLGLANIPESNALITNADCGVHPWSRMLNGTLRLARSVCEWLNNKTTIVHLQKIWKTMYTALEQYGNAMEIAGKNYRLPNPWYQIGQRVWLSTHSHKYWPLKISRVILSSSIRVQVPSHMRIHFLFSMCPRLNSLQCSTFALFHHSPLYLQLRAGGHLSKLSSPSLSALVLHCAWGTPSQGLLLMEPLS